MPYSQQAKKKPQRGNSGARDKNQGHRGDAASMLAHQYTVEHSALQAFGLSFGEVPPVKEEPQADPSHQTPVLRAWTPTRINGTTPERARRACSSETGCSLMREFSWLRAASGCGSALRPGPHVLTTKTPGATEWQRPLSGQSAALPHSD